MNASRIVARTSCFLLALGVLSVLRPTPGVTEPRPVSIFAAASLGDAFRSLKGPFEQKHPGWKLQLNFAASSTLRVQIQQGAPADLFASADQAQMQPLVDGRRVHSPVVFARNRLALVVPERNPARIASPKDLARPHLRLIRTPPSVPIGTYTRQALEKLSRLPGYPRDFAARVERNTASQEANVRATLAKVELGEGDAAFVYETDARSSRRVRVITLPEAANVTVEYPVAVITGTAQRAGAETFVRYLTSPEGRSALRRHGFR